MILCDSGNFKADPDEMFGGERTVTDRPRGAGLADPQGTGRGAAVGHPRHADVLHDVAPDRPLLRPVGRHRRRVGRLGGHGPHGPRAVPAPRRPRRQRQPDRPRRRRALQHGHGARDDHRGRVRPRHGQDRPRRHVHAGLGVQPAALGHGLERRGPGRAHAPPRGLPGMSTRQHQPASGEDVRGPHRPRACSGRRPPGRSARSIDRAWSSRPAGSTRTSPTTSPRRPSLPAAPRRAATRGGEPGGHDGYVVQPVCNDDGFRVELFDAANVSAGPIATLAGTHRETIPMVLHSAWMPAFHELADAERLRFSDEVTADTLASVPDRAPRRGARRRRGVRRPVVSVPAGLLIAGGSVISGTGAPRTRPDRRVPRGRPDRGGRRRRSGSGRRRRPGRRAASTPPASR